MIFFFFFFFFFNDTATTEIYTLSLHDALPILVESPADVVAIESSGSYRGRYFVLMGHLSPLDGIGPEQLDRKSTRLNSSHSQISYAVFCLKKKKNQYKKSPIMN